MELELLAVVRAVDVPGAEALAHLDEERVARVAGDLVGEPRARARDPVRLEEGVRQVLVAHRPAHLGCRGEDERGRQLLPARRDDLLVEVGERHDEPHVVLGDEPRQRRNVRRIVDPWHEGSVMSVVERRCERVEVGGDGGRARSPEGADDVDALAGAGEENRRHLDVGG